VRGEETSEGVPFDSWVKFLLRPANFDQKLAYDGTKPRIKRGGRKTKKAPPGGSTPLLTGGPPGQGVGRKNPIHLNIKGLGI